MVFPKKKVPDLPSPPAKEEKAVDQKTDLWVVGEVPTQVAPVIENMKTGEQLDLYFALASIKNDLEYIKSFLD